MHTIFFLLVYYLYWVCISLFPICHCYTVPCCGTNKWSSYLILSNLPHGPKSVYETTFKFTIWIFLFGSAPNCTHSYIYLSPLNMTGSNCSLINQWKCKKNNMILKWVHPVSFDRWLHINRLSTGSLNGLLHLHQHQLDELKTAPERTIHMIYEQAFLRWSCYGGGSYMLLYHTGSVSGTTLQGVTKSSRSAATV